MTLRVAVIGAGRIGRVHALNATAHAGSEVAAIVDTDDAAAHRLADDVAARVATLDEVLADASVGAVVVCSPTDTHADVAEAVAASGRAIFCEKPVAHDLERTRLCVSLIAAAGVPLLVGFNRRFDPQVRRLRARIAAGDIGDVELVTVMSKDPGPPPRGYLEHSGGLFRDMTIHDFDMARHLLGAEPVRVNAQAAALVNDDIRAIGDVDTAVITLQTEDGRLAVITNSRRATYGYDQRIEVHGSRGMVSMDNIRTSSVALADGGGSHADPALDFFIARYAEAYRNEWQHFVDMVDGGVAAEATGHDAERALALADAALQSLRSQSSVAVAPLTHAGAAS